MGSTLGPYPVLYSVKNSAADPYSDSQLCPGRGRKPLPGESGYPHDEWEVCTMCAYVRAMRFIPVHFERHTYTPASCCRPLICSTGKCSTERETLEKPSGQRYTRYIPLVIFYMR